jgi:eukaryotic-like serine/threonine-protein kinase
MHVEEFGPYLVYEQIGAGGMATVHRAIKRGIEGFERSVALKRLLPHLAADETFVRSFVREARLAALLNHTNIAQIHDLGRIDDTYYIAMDLITGVDLRLLLGRLAGTIGPMPVAHALNVIAQVCSGLDHAHNARDPGGAPLGVVHRDISPANLIVGHDGLVKIIDFGIARAASSSRRTATGTLKGKFSYMAPETVAGHSDARSDLFAVGAVAYELLTARPLFKGETDMETLEQIRHRDVPPPSTINVSVEPGVDALVLTALAKDPEARWRSAARMRAEIDRLIARYGHRASNGEVHGWIDWAMRQPLPLESGVLDLAHLSGEAPIPIERTPVRVASDPAHARTLQPGEVSSGSGYAALPATPEPPRTTLPGWGMPAPPPAITAQAMYGWNGPVPAPLPPSDSRPAAGTLPPPDAPIAAAPARRGGARDVLAIALLCVAVALIAFLVASQFV